VFGGCAGAGADGGGGGARVVAVTHRRMYRPIDSTLPLHAFMDPKRTEPNRKQGVVYDSDPKKRNLQMQRTANALKSNRLRTYVEKITKVRRSLEVSGGGRGGCLFERERERGGGGNIEKGDGWGKALSRVA
jgi:hypothetical protein